MSSLSISHHRLKIGPIATGLMGIGRRDSVSIPCPQEPQNQGREARQGTSHQSWTRRGHHSPPPDIPSEAGLWEVPGVALTHLGSPFSAERRSG